MPGVGPILTQWGAPKVSPQMMAIFFHSSPWGTMGLWCELVLTPTDIAWCFTSITDCLTELTTEIPQRNNKSNIFLNPFLNQQMSQSAIQKLSLMITLLSSGWPKWPHSRCMLCCAYLTYCSLWLNNCQHLIRIWSSGIGRFVLDIHMLVCSDQCSDQKYFCSETLTMPFVCVFCVFSTPSSLDIPPELHWDQRSNYSQHWVEYSCMLMCANMQ